MRDNKEPSLLKEWIRGARSRGSSFFNRKRNGGSERNRLPRKRGEGNDDSQKFSLSNLSEYSGWIRLGLLILAVFLLSEISSRIIGLFVRPTYTALPRKSVTASRPSAPAEDYDSILRRNIFNVEGKIPDPFDQGRLDCFSQARPSSQRLTLLGTIVMNEERHSVALIQEEGATQKSAVKKDDMFSDGKYQALKVDRKKLCFQVKSTQEFEYVEIPDDSVGLGVSGPTIGGGAEGITAVSENDFVVKQNFLEKNLLNLNEILQTARAVPYVEPGSGRFRGFLIQSIDSGSPFAQLGIRQGDVLTAVNDIVLDNAGKGLEAFQRLRGANKVALKVLRGGSETAINYDVK